MLEKSKTLLFGKKRRGRGPTMLHPENVIYNALIRTPAESTLKQHANELADLGVVFLNDNEYIGVKQHDFVSSSTTEVCTFEKCRWVMFKNVDQ